MGKTHQETIKGIVVDFLQKMGFQAEADVFVEDGIPQTFLCVVRVESDQNFLIGQYGVNLAAVQHLVRIMLYKKTQERLDVVIDINEYLINKKALLEQEAEKATKEALQDRISVAFRPMLSYERKIIHTFLAKNQNVTTESVGEGNSRKIIVRPKLN